MYIYIIYLFFRGGCINVKSIHEFSQHVCLMFYLRKEMLIRHTYLYVEGITVFLVALHTVRYACLQTALKATKYKSKCFLFDLFSAFIKISVRL